MRATVIHEELDAARVTLAELRDLSDLCQFWPVLRTLVAEDRLSGLDMDADTRALIGWMVELADRTCPAEIG